MSFRKNILADLTFLTTFMAFFLYTSGNAYIGGFMRNFGYTEGALGLTLQDYFMIGGLNNISGIFLIFLALLLLSLVNTLYDRALHISMIKGIKFLIFFPFSFIYQWVIEYGKFPEKLAIDISYTKQNIKNSLNNRNKGNHPIKFLVNNISNKTNSSIQTRLNWKDEIDTENIKEGTNEILQYYYYLILLYILVTIILLSFVNMEKKGIREAQDSLNFEDEELIFKDELIENYLSKNYKDIPSPLKGKVLKCGPTNCLIAINIEDLAYKGKKPIIQKKYIFKPIKNDGYPTFYDNF
ncbi:TPA: hypothetical protein L3H12_002126 [Acinetobacter baumannii]|uniref:hypothetical protein n=1 Tax=Acinetobacter baumannii TaxID=470 RepID=UPI00041FA909|nr:hypothetical protein [Acinetobacter baumannii]RSP29928.1 hypothetical protein EA730_16510 [Acinetobacter baumannii]HBN5965405.1 hypothetical protein [Acinetobacter baumannii]